ncbi:MAG: HAD family phosphatase, partial [Oscillospiraceae bacterium]|nr:HAD family phosphatase [Oscillospiraceae bacterium]
MKGVIFDFNGTMIFDKEFHDEAWRKFLENRMQREISEEEFEEHVYGRSAQDILSYFLECEISGQESIRIEEEKEKIYRELCLRSPDFHLAEGLPEFLDKLKEQGIPVTIATASARKNMEFFFEHLPLARWFDLNHVVYNDGTFRGKPAPDIFLKASEL